MITRFSKLLTSAIVLHVALHDHPVTAITIPMVHVGNPGNADDTPTPDPNFHVGAVGYAYNIGTYDVTNAQYSEFLNAKAASDPLGLYSLSRGDDPTSGITQSGVSGSFTYATKASMADLPVNFVSWFDAIRFANWLNNGQGNGDTETGAYTLLGGTPTPSNGNTITRNAEAKVFLPTENEWYKAAYYNPTTSSYYMYPTSSNTIPTASGPTATPNSANYDNVGLTPVGAYSSTTSPYGAFDMGGNVWQLDETLMNNLTIGNRITRGGSFNLHSDAMLSSFRGQLGPTDVGSYVGFRVAMVPEPSTLALAAIGAVALLATRRIQSLPLPKTQ